MALHKYASFVIQEAWMAGDETPRALHLDRLPKTGHRHEFKYSPRPGYLYVRSRAISSRCNDNFDEFPADEIKTAYLTFVGKPVFVNHHNDDHRRARGVIIDAALHEDTNPDGTPDTWCEVLMEVDAVRFPKLAKAILAGHIDRTSMGTDVAFSVCSYCGNKASTPLEYCRHIPKLKGQRIRRTTASGSQEDVLVREICYGLKFFENSLLVEEPADPTAYFLGVDARGMGIEASLNAVQDAVAEEFYSPKVAAYTTADRDAAKVYLDFYDGSITKQEYVQRLEALESQSPVATKLLGVWDGTMTKQDAVRLAEEVLPPGWQESGHIWSEDRGEWSQSFGSKTASKVGYGEQVAPPVVDTMRDEECPVCGEKDSYDGDRCNVCHFMKPPDEFMDPDLEKAKQTDLRQDQGKDLPADADAVEGSDLEQTDDPNAVNTEPGSEDLIFHPPAEATEDPSLDNPDAVVDPNADPQAEVVDEAEDADADEDEEDAEDDPEGADDGKPDFLKKKPKKKKPAVPQRQSAVRSQKEKSMRPTLAALAEQQIMIEAQNRKIAEIADLAGIDLSHIDDETNGRVANLRAQADVNNPAQPIPEPAEEAPAVTTDEALGNLNDADVTAPGSTGVTDVSPDATTTVENTGTVLDEPLDLNEQDPTKPVAGTTGERPLDEVKIETEVRVGEGDNTSTMFPLQGPFANRPTTGQRTFASLRLARLRIQAGTEGGDDLELGERIAYSDLSDEMIQHEIETLASVVRANPQGAGEGQRRLVPRSAAGQRNAPSLASDVVPSMESLALEAGRVQADEVLFEG